MIANRDISFRLTIDIPAKALERFSNKSDMILKDYDYDSPEHSITQVFKYMEEQINNTLIEEISSMITTMLNELNGAIDSNDKCLIEINHNVKEVTK